MGTIVQTRHRQSHTLDAFSIFRMNHEQKLNNIKKIDYLFFWLQVSSSLRRLRANKKKSVFMDDVDMESTVANLHSRSRLGLAEKILESAGVGEGSETRRRVARVDDSSTTARWTAVEETSSSAASRARASRARLSDLEEESNAIQQRQAARERRAADLRAFIATTDAD